MRATVTTAREVLANAPRDRRPMTGVVPLNQRDTFRAPVSRPGADTRREGWSTVSVNGWWRYDRLDEQGTPWRVTFLPTGQYREAYPNLPAARRDTAGGLLDALRGQAAAAAFRGGTVDERAVGQRWVAVHARLAGSDEVDFRCRCGGMLAAADEAGTVLVHVDACGDCYDAGRVVTAGPLGEVCELADGHRFCGSPERVECGHHGDDRRYGRCDLPAAPNGGAGCGRGLAVDCCGVCCQGGE